jgi:hypothetical protein
MWSLAPDIGHEIAQMFHLHVGIIWLKDAAGLDLLPGVVAEVMKVNI